MKVDSIIFDLDGTLWNSSKQVTDSWNVVLQRYGINRTLTVEDLMSVMGMLMEDIIRTLFPEMEEEERLQLLHACCEYENEYVARVGGVLFEGLEETLAELARTHKLFIVSNCQAGYIEAFMQAHQLHAHFIDFENPGRTGLPKADNIRLIMERNHLERPVYVGDTLGDCNAAKMAGIPFIFARYGYGEVTEYDAAIDSIRDLLHIIE